MKECIYDTRYEEEKMAGSRYFEPYLELMLFSYRINNEKESIF